MAALPYMQFYVADYLADTMHLSTEEHGAYLLLIFNYWQTGKPLPKNRLAGIARLSNDRWTDVERSLNEFFIDDGNAWVHQRIERDLLSVKGAQSQRSEAGKISAQKRLAKKNKGNQSQSNDRSTGVERDGNDRSTNIDTDTDKELKDKHLLSGAEKSQLQTSDPVFITLPLNDGTEFPVTEPMLVEYGELYPSVDVGQELRNQRGWLLSEPSKRKTKRGIKRFITGWLSREQDRGPKAKVSTGENHAEFRPNQNDQRSYYEQFTEWEQKQPGAASLGSMGGDVQDVRPALECEEWQSTLGAVGGTGQLDDE
ncbi:YdaU family protein [Serratia marcescens]|uniref:YdaU family protein n=1 Tax=Serratia marcescens TaxID=615 RepID=UPI00069E0576